VLIKDAEIDRKLIHDRDSHSGSEREAEAAASGLFGTGNEKVSPQEALALGKLKAVLTV
jgi:hypothetical protein